jgi:hypothetical protein
LDLVEEPFAGAAQAGVDETGEIHPGQEVAEDGMGAEGMDGQSDGALGSASARLPYIHKYDINIPEQCLRQAKCHDCTGSAGG